MARFVIASLLLLSAYGAPPTVDLSVILPVGSTRDLVNFTASLSGVGAVQTVALDVDGVDLPVEWHSWETYFGGPVSLLAAGMAPGTHTLRLRAWNYSGEAGEDSKSVVLRPAPAALTLSFFSPATNAVLLSNELLRFSGIIDWVNPLTNVQALIDHQSIPLELYIQTNDCTFNVNIGANDITNGLHDLTIMAVDDHGVLAEATLPFRYNVLPTIQITKPNPTAVWFPEAPIEVTASDADGDVTLTCTLSDRMGERLILSGVNSVRGSAKISGLGTLTFTATDALGATTTVTSTAIGTTNESLILEAQLPGKILDVRGNRVLYQVGQGYEGHLYVTNLLGTLEMTADIQTWSQPIAYLTPRGIIATAAITTALNWIYEQDTNGVVTKYFVTGADLGPREGDRVLLRGIWGGSFIAIHDLATGSDFTLQQPASVDLSRGIDFSQPDRIAYVTASGVYLNSSPIDPSPSAALPRTDGENVLFVKDNGLFLHNTIGETRRITTALVPPLDAHSHDLKNSELYYAVQIGDGKSQLMRGPIDAPVRALGTAVTNAYIWKINSKGDVIWGSLDTTTGVLGGGFINDTPIGTLELPLQIQAEGTIWRGILPDAGIVFRITTNAVDVRVEASQFVISIATSASSSKLEISDDLGAGGRWTSLEATATPNANRLEYRIPTTKQAQFVRYSSP